MRKILSVLRKADEKFSLIHTGDKIAVGLSGGKDSMLLLYALTLYSRYQKKFFDLCALTVDLGFGNYDIEKIKDFARSLKVEHDVVKTDIANVVFSVRKEKNPCALCAKMRKGAFYARAKEMGADKAAFAHHGDDVIQTLLMSLLYERRLNTFSPKSYLSRKQITLIRPFVLLREDEIKRAVRRNQIPIAKNPCPADRHTKRDEAAELIQNLCAIHPDADQKMLAAVSNTKEYNLWDKDFDF